MLVYSAKLVMEALREVCAKFEKTKNIKIKKVKFSPDKKKYEITLADGAVRLLEQELISTYIESLGDKGALRIAGHLSHDPELEESINKEKLPEINEFWDGDIDKAYDYLRDKDKNQEK